MKLINILIFFVAIMMSANIFAQDMIIKNSNDTIHCKIKELGTNEIKYILPNYPQDVLFAIDVDHVLKVVFSNGIEKTYMKEIDNPANYVNDKKNALKVHLFSPIFGHFSLSYEKSISPGKSMEFGVGYIFGKEEYGIDEKGVILRAGFKFIRSPDFYFNRMKYAHILKGSYIKPEIIVNAFSSNSRSHNNYGSSVANENPVLSVAILIEAGKQIVYSNSFVFDTFVGIGYGVSNNKSNSFYYSNTIVTDDSFPLSFTAGLRIGFLFK